MRSCRVACTPARGKAQPAHNAAPRRILASLPDGFPFPVLVRSLAPGAPSFVGSGGSLAAYAYAGCHVAVVLLPQAYLLRLRPLRLAFADVQRPEMDGMEATVTIREKEKSTLNHLPIIALTANAMVGDQERLCWPVWTATFRNLSVQKNLFKWSRRMRLLNRDPKNVVMGVDPSGPVYARTISTFAGWGLAV
jgi:CheY-like chemotaxis protein